MVISDTDFIIWDEVCIRILAIKHTIIKKENVCYLFENSAFLYVLCKTGKIQIGETPYIVTSNKLVHVAPNNEIKILSDSDEIECFIIVYQPEFTQSVRRDMLRLEIHKSPFMRCISLKVSNQFFFTEQFSSIYNVWNCSLQKHVLELKTKLYAIVNKFYEEMETNNSKTDDLDIVEIVKLYMQENYYKTVSIQEIANMVGVSRITLYEKFKKYLGDGPQEYLKQIRLKNAIRMLVNEEMSLNDVAISCGLRDKSYFSRVFKEKFGVSPGKYRIEKKAINNSKDNQVMRYQHGKNSIQTRNKEKVVKYLSVNNFGRIHRYYARPKRIVCLDYAAAEFCVALGMIDSVVGVASAETILNDCAKEYRDKISRLPFIHGRASRNNVPDFQTIRSYNPDLVIGTAYAFCSPMGVSSAETFEQFGIHIYALQGTCMIGSTFEDVYRDIENLGEIFGKENEAEKIINRMKHQEYQLEDKISNRSQKPVRVFVFDSTVDDMAFTSGQSIETHIIKAAGGINMFCKLKKQFVPVHWSEVAEVNPEVIIVHCFYEERDALQKIALLKRISEIKDVDAIRNNCIYTLGIKKVFPAIDNLETAYKLACWFDANVAPSI